MWLPICLSTHAHDSINQSMCGVMGPLGPIGAHLDLLVPGPRRERVRKNGVWGIATRCKLQASSCKPQAARWRLQAANGKLRATSGKLHTINCKTTSRAAAGCKPLISSAIQAEGQEPKRPNGQRGQQGQRPNKQHPLRCSWPKANRAKCPINNISYDVLRPSWSLAKGPTRPIRP